MNTYTYKLKVTLRFVFADYIHIYYITSEKYRNV